MVIDENYYKRHPESKWFKLVQSLEERERGKNNRKSSSKQAIQLSDTRCLQRVEGNFIGH